MRKLTAFLLPVAAVGALVASSLVVAGSAAAGSWGDGNGYGYGYGGGHRDNSGYNPGYNPGYSSGYNSGYGYGYGYGNNERQDQFDRYRGSAPYRYERRGDGRDGWDRGERDYGEPGRRDGGYGYAYGYDRGDHRWR